MRLLKIVAPVLLALLSATAFAGAASKLTAIPVPKAANYAPIVLLSDTGSGQVLYARNADQRFLPASVTKVMTAYVAFDLIARHHLSPAQTMTMSNAAFAKWRGKGTSMDLRAGERVSIDDLLMGIATVSANDGSVVLAEGATGSVENWVAMMNQAAAQLGMKDSHFATPNGWPDHGATKVSARDLTVLATAMITRYPALYHRYFGHPQMRWHGHIEHSHDPTAGVIAGADGIKTGHTYEAGFNFLGSAERDGHRLVLVVAGAHTEEARAAVSRALIEWGYAAWDRKPLFPAGSRVGWAKVHGGHARWVALIAAHPIYAVLPKGQNPVISFIAAGNRRLEAPVAKGDQAGSLKITVAGQPPSSVPLMAGNSVVKGGVIDHVLNFLAELWPW